MKKTLIACGCSVTYGTELKDIGEKTEKSSNFAWPALLAKKFDIELINLARSGAGNDYIVRQIIENVNPKNAANTIVGIMWTQPDRFEYHDGYTWKCYGPWSINEKAYAKFSNNSTYKSWIDHYYLEGQNLYYSGYKTLSNILLLQRYLKSLNVDYFMQLTHSKRLMTHNGEFIFNLKGMEHFREYIDWDKFFFFDSDLMTSFQEIVDGYPYGKNGHYLEEAHHDYVNDYLYPWVNERFKWNMEN